MENLTEQIEEHCIQIFKNLNIQAEIEEDQLYKEQIYFEIYKIMFPFLEVDIDNIASKKANRGQKIQQLIDLLSDYVLTMDLSHIKGESIANGDQKHLHYFLQLLYELSRLYVQQQDTSQQEQESNDGKFQEIDYDQGDYEDQMGYPEIDQQSGPELSRSRRSEEQSQKGSKIMDSNKQIHRSKSTRDLVDPEKQSIPNTKQNQLKALEDNILQVTQKQQRVLTSDPNLPKKTKKAQKPKPPQSQPQVTAEEISEVDIDFLENVDPDQLQNLPEDHPDLLKYQRELEKLEYFNEQEKMEKQLQNENLDDVIEAQIHNVKKNLEYMQKDKLPMDEQKTIEQILRKRNEYKMFLKDYLTQYNQKQGQMKKSRSRQQTSQQTKLKKIRYDDQQLKKQFEVDQMSTYYKMRDEKLNYLRKIHRIIFELEKRKIIDEKKDHLQVRRQQNIATRNALTSIENAYNDRIQMLKDKLRQERAERHQASVAQKQILSKLERELKGEKMKQIDQLKDIYKREKERFDFLIKDDGELEQKILQIYKKY